MFKDEKRYYSPHDEGQDGLSFDHPVFRDKDRSDSDLALFIAEATEDILTAFLGGNIFIRFFTSNLLQHLWGLVNTLQIIVLMNLFSLEIPENAELLMTKILKLCALEFIPKD